MQQRDPNEAAGRWRPRALGAPTLLFLAALALFGPPAPAAAQSLYREGFEGPDTSWTFGETDTKYRLLKHVRVGDGVHGGTTCEFLHLAPGQGSHLYLLQPIEPARVIAELAPSVWVKADRPGVQMLVRVVLPRSIQARTGKPLLTMLLGTTYSRVGSWEQLSVPHLAEALNRQLRVLRSQYGPNVDGREAYVDLVVLNAYTGADDVQLWIDDLEIAGLVRRDDVAVAPRESGTNQAPGTRPAQNVSTTTTVTTQATLQPKPGNAAPPPAIPGEANRLRAEDDSGPRLQGAKLMYGAQPLLPRIIRHQGEPFPLLKELGFNMVRLAETPSEAQLAEAQAQGLWLIAPPPPLEVVESQGIPPQLAPIVAWDLGSDLTASDVEATRRWAQAIRTRDPRASRPLVVGCHTDLRSYSRIADVLLVGREVIGTSLEMPDYARWLAGQPRLARPGSPMWATIQTDLSPLLLAQWRVLAGPDCAAAGLSGQQLRTLLNASLAAGARGFYFESRTSLAETDRETRRRRMLLELVNLELALIEPWAAAGSFVTSASSSDKDVVGVVLQTERARLVLPIRTAAHDQFASEPLGASARTFVVPGVPDTNDAYELTPAGMFPLANKRVTGGIRVTQEAYTGDSMIVLSGDPLIVASLQRQVFRSQRRAAQLQRDLAAGLYQQVEAIEKQLGPATGKTELAGWLATAKLGADGSSAALAGGDARRAYEKARETLVMLGRVQRVRWTDIAQRWPLVVASPLAVHYTTLPEQLVFTRQLEASRTGLNVLGGGEVESLDAMLRAGWRHFQHPQGKIASDVELSPAGPHGGQFSLRMRAWTDEQGVAPLIESAPVWVNTAPVSVAAGQIVRIRGWYKAPQPIAGSVDGLMVIDSLGGPALAARLGATGQWKEFNLFRAAPQATELTVTFALSGLGEVFLDDLAIEPIEAGSAQPEQARSGLPAPR